MYGQKMVVVYTYARYNDNTPVIKIKNYNDITELELEAKN